MRLRNILNTFVIVILTYGERRIMEMHIRLIRAQRTQQYRTPSPKYSGIAPALTDLHFTHTWLTADPNRNFG